MSNEEYRQMADDFFEKTNDLVALHEYCQNLLKIPTLQRLLDKSKINKRFQECTFDKYKTTTDAQVKAKQQAIDYARNIKEHFETGTNLIFTGNGCVGTGKTHLACAVAQEVMKQGIPSKFINVTSMISEIKEKFDITEYLEVDLLVIDDLGKEKGTEWVCEQIYSILNSRYEAKKPTVITTEGSIDDLEYNYGKNGNAIISRLVQKFVLVDLSGSDFRKQRS